MNLHHPDITCFEWSCAGGGRVGSYDSFLQEYPYGDYTVIISSYHHRVKAWLNAIAHSLMLPGLERGR
jgi:hypothetical protein